MATQTLPLDAARPLTSRQAQAELLSDAMASGDAGNIANALGVIACARGMTEVARGASVTRDALYRALSEDGDPRLTTVLGVMKSLGFQLSVEAAG